MVKNITKHTSQNLKIFGIMEILLRELIKNGFIMRGRSDATLNPGGVRIGTSEIYQQVEDIDFITEGLVVGQDFDDDVRIILFVTTKNDQEIDDEKN